IGIGPQTPVLPLRTCSDSVATAFESFAYLAATSLYAGPISFLSTAWQAVQFLAFASSRLAMAVPEAQASARAIEIGIAFMTSPVELMTLRRMLSVFECTAGPRSIAPAWPRTRAATASNNNGRR